MTKDINRLTKVLHHISMRELDDDILIDKYFGILANITNNLKSVLEYDDEHLKYDRIDWIDRGSEEGYWSNPMRYEKDSDLESITILIAQLIRYNKLIKKN